MKKQRQPRSRRVLARVVAEETPLLKQPEGPERPMWFTTSPSKDDRIY